MSNYTKTTDFEAKDSLPSGDSGKIIRGSEFETEFDNIATAIASKSDANNPTFTGTVTIDGLTVNGNTVLGNAATDTVTVTADIASNLLPSADDTYNLGAVGAEWNDLFIDGVANIDSLVADTVDINGGTVDGVTIGGSSAGAITGTTITGTSFVTSGDMTFGDNDKAVFGAGSDLQIFHDGANSYVKDAGTGDLFLQGSGNVQIESTSGANMIYATAGAQVRLFYNGSPKFNTTDTGIDVSGSVTADGLTVDGDITLDTEGDKILFETSNVLLTPSIYADDDDIGNSLKITADNGVLVRIDERNAGSGGFKVQNGSTHKEALFVNNNGDISFYEDTGTTAKFFWDASAESLGIGTSSPTTALHVDGTVTADTHFTSSDLNATLSTSGSGGTVRLRPNGISSTTGEVLLDSSGNVGIGTSSPSKKLHIRGSTITGATADTNTLLYLEQNANASIQINSGATNNGQIRFGDASSNYRGALTYQHSDDSLQFVSAGSERMRINSAGQVGIGTSSPSADLHINNASGSELRLDTEGGSNANSLLNFRENGTDRASLYWDGGANGLNLETTFGDIALMPTGNVGIGTSSPAGSYTQTLHIHGSGTGASLHITDPTSGATASDGLEVFQYGTDGYIWERESGNLRFGTAATERMRIDSSGNVGIGTTSPSVSLEVDGTIKASGNGKLQIADATEGSTFEFNVGGGGALEIYDGSTERMRLDASGNLLVGTTSTTPQTGDHGFVARANGYTIASMDDARAMLLNRATSDGEILNFRKDGTTVGSIGSFSGVVSYIALDPRTSGVNGAGLMGGSLSQTEGTIQPTNGAGAKDDDAINLGASNNRFKDIYATNGTIQTSDRNEKQDIEELSDAEQRVAVACKGLLRKFRWKSAVEEKGDDARIHFGIIAQDLQDAFTAEGLDAGRYAMFINSTWTDEETGEERSRMGVRYSELLAFIISAI